MVEVKGTLEELHELFGGSHTSTRKGGKRKTARRAYEPKKGSPKKKGKPMSRKTQLAINRGRRAKGIKPIKWKKKGK